MYPQRTPASGKPKTKCFNELVGETSLDLSNSIKAEHTNGIALLYPHNTSISVKAAMNMNLCNYSDTCSVSLRNVGQEPPSIRPFAEAYKCII